MFDMTPSDILKMEGKWMRSSEFIKLISDRLKISERHAHRLIKNDKQILRLTLQDRTVLYGLPEFGLPKFEEKETETETFKAALRRHYQLMLGLAEQLYLEGEWLKSQDTLRLLVKELPKPQREKLEQQFRGVLYGRYFSGYEIENLIAAVVEALSEIS